MAMNYEMTPQDYIRILARRWWIIVIASFTVFITSIVYTNSLTPIYNASGQVELQYRANIATLLADAFLYQGNELATVEQLARSTDVLGAAAEELGLVASDADHASRLVAATSLGGRLSVSEVSNTYLLTISYSSEDPEYAARVTETVMRVLRDTYNARAHEGDREVQDFIETHFRDAEASLREREEALLRLNEDDMLIDLDPSIEVDIDHASEIEAEYRQVRSEREDLETRYARLRQDIESGNPSATSAAYVQNHPSVRQIREDLFQAELEMGNLLRTYTRQHPQVREAANRIRLLQGRLSTTIQGLFTERLAEMETRIDALSERETELQRLIPELNRRIAELPQRQLERAQLERDIRMYERLRDFFQQKLQERQIESMLNLGNTIEIISHARTPTTPIYPPARTNMLMGLAIGFLLGVGLAFVLESLDTSIGTIEDVERFTGLPVVGVIPHIQADEAVAEAGKVVTAMDSSRVRMGEVKERLMELERSVMASGAAGQDRFRPQLITHLDPKSPVSEAYRTLRTNIQFKARSRRAKTITVTSSGPQEGKTTTLANLAVVIAQSGMKTVAMGCNLRRPALHKLFGVEKKPGLTDVLIGARQWREVVQPSGIDNLEILTSGPIPPNPAELLQSREMDEVLKEIEGEYDAVIFDTPPILPVTDSAIMASKSDVTLLVYYVGKAAREALLRAKVQLDNVNANIIGIALNHIKAEGKLGYSYYYYHYHYYGESTEQKRRR